MHHDVLLASTRVGVRIRFCWSQLPPVAVREHLALLVALRKEGVELRPVGVVEDGPQNVCEEQSCLGTARVAFNECKILEAAAFLVFLARIPSFVSENVALHLTAEVKRKGERCLG